MATGFILHPTYRYEGDVPVIHLWGVLEDGSSFLVRDRRFRPYFFVLERDAPRVARWRARVEPTPLTSMSSDPVARITLASPAAHNGLRERLEAAAIGTFESDLRFTTRYLLDHRIKGALRIAGDSSPGERVAHVFEDPDIAPAEWLPVLRSLSLDIETDASTNRILSFALHARAVSEVWLVRGGQGELPGFAREVADERSLLAALVRRVREIDPDVLTGWNVIGFDLRVLAARAQTLGVALTIGRGASPLVVRIDDRSFRASSAEVEGRVVLDGVDLVRGAFLKFDDYRLDTVARALLGQGKTVTARDRAREIARLWHEDRDRFCRYNLRDAELVTRILDVTGLIRLAVSRSLLTGMPLDRVSASIATLDALYLPLLRERGMVAPAVRTSRGGEHTSGGAVLESSPGLYRNVLVFDFKSLYPSIMRTFNIDPLSHRPQPAAGEDVIRTPSGVCFDRRPGIIPALLGQLLAVRAAARLRGDAIAAQATKILMNSFYGVLATSACRFHSFPVANAITESGQALLFWTRDVAAASGFRVLYGDTDSLFVSSGVEAGTEAWAVGRELASTLNRLLARHIEDTYRVESQLEIELDELFLKIYFPHLRRSSHGARKRYAGLVEREGEKVVEFVGMESVRRDSSEAARAFQHGIYARLFAGRPVSDFVRDFVAEVRAGRRDGELVYKKALRKDVAEYTATTPPHVQAARLRGHRGRLVEYVITRAGPAPLGDERAALDHEHYVERELRPIGEQVLEHLGHDWDEVVGNPRQLRLL